jgi:hypothetical protein
MVLIVEVDLAAIGPDSPRLPSRVRDVLRGHRRSRRTSSPACCGIVSMVRPSVRRVLARSLNGFALHAFGGFATPQVILLQDVDTVGERGAVIVPGRPAG